MAIDILRFKGRRLIVWFGGPPPPSATQTFLDHELEVGSCTDHDLATHEFLASLGAAVFTQEVRKLSRIEHALREHAKRLLDYDCRIIVRPAPNQDLSTLTKLFNFLRLPTAGLL